jgi:NNP family nitrate/nitrite transporter-like MFS transporter
MIQRTTLFTLPAFIAGIATVLVLGGGILLGSRNLRNYDPTLLLYTFGAMFSAFALAYRYTVWLQRPPTRVYWRRGWQLVARRSEVRRTLLTLAGALSSNFVAQNFIRQRGWGRWVAHWCMSWGTILACAVALPLVFGWIHFESEAHAPQVYQVLAFGVRVGAFHTESSWMRYVFFNLLNLSALLVIIGVGLTLHRRLKEVGVMAVQQFGNDLVPLLLLLAVAVTGLMLTVSMHALHGEGYVVISLIHAVTVIAMLLYVPFGKLFHIFQRPLHLAVTLYKRANAAAPPAVCSLCGEGFAGAMHVEDLKGVLAEVGLDWRLPGPVAHYMHVCPRCRRRQVGIWHGQAMTGQAKSTGG